MNKCIAEENKSRLPPRAYSRGECIATVHRTQSSVEGVYGELLNIMKVLSPKLYNSNNRLQRTRMVMYNGHFRAFGREKTIAGYIIERSLNTCDLSSALLFQTQKHNAHTMILIIILKGLRIFFQCTLV